MPSSTFYPNAASRFARPRAIKSQVTTNFDPRRWKSLTSGIRAKRGKRGFSRGNVGVIAQGAADVAFFQRFNLGDFEDADLFVLGYDTREDSRDVSMFVAQIFWANGWKPVISDSFVSSPEFSYYVTQRGKHMPPQLITGCLITGSHLKSIENGVCWVMSNGAVATANLTQVVVDRHQVVPGTPIAYTLPSFNGPTYEGSETFRGTPRVDMQTPYLRAVRATPIFDGLDGRRLKVVVDPMQGCGGRASKALLRAANFDVTMINDQRLIRSGDRHPYPRAGNLEDLEGAVGGTFIDWNELFPLYMDYLIEKRMWEGTELSCTHTTTRVLDVIAEHHGFKVFRRPVGFKHVSNDLMRDTCFAGFEGNGGLAFKFVIVDKDGILSNLLMARIVSERLAGQVVPGGIGLALDGDADRFTIADSAEGHIRQMIRATLANYKIPEDFGFMREVFIPVTNGAEQRIIEKIGDFDRDPARAFSSGDIKQTEEFEDGTGTKVVTLHDDSWVIVRFSGTERGARLYVESPRVVRREQVIDHMLKYLEAA